jgi:Ca2+/Na+ antiporter
MNDSQNQRVATKTVEVSICILLVALCLSLCRWYGYADVPSWISWALIIPVVLFWLTVLLLAFIAFVLCVIAKVDKEIEEERRQQQQNNEELW